MEEDLKNTDVTLPDAVCAKHSIVLKAMASHSIFYQVKVTNNW